MVLRLIIFMVLFKIDFLHQLLPILKQGFPLHIKKKVYPLDKKNICGDLA